MARVDDNKEQILERLDLLIHLIGYQAVMGYETIEAKVLTLISLGLGPVEIAKICSTPIRPITEVAARLELNLSERLAAFLAEHKINTIKDILRVGGLHRMNDLPVAADDPVVKILDAQANLSTLPTTIEENAHLIAKGFDSISAITSTQSKEFVSSFGYVFRHQEAAARVHATARAQQKMLDTILADIDDLANGRVPM